MEWVNISNFPVFGDPIVSAQLHKAIAPHQRYPLVEPRLVRCEDAVLAGSHLICIKNGRVLDESFRGYKSFTRSPFLSVTAQGDVAWNEDAVSSIHVDSDVAAVGAKAQGAFFHWLIEIVPRLMFAREEVRDGRPLIMRPSPATFQQETFEALDLAPRFMEENIIRVRSVEFPRHLISYRVRGSLSPFIVDELQRFAFEYLQIEEPKRSNRRIYISRGDAPKRRIRNEPELIDFLVAKGFEIIHMSHLTLREQAALFRSAGMVVGPHGAGLSSLAYCKPGTKVVELYPSGFIAVSPFWNLASLASLDYSMVLCEAHPEKAPSGKDPYHDADTIVDLRILNNVL